MSKYNEKQKKYSLEYMRKNQKRIPLDWLKSDFEQRIRPAIKYLGYSLNTFIKTAVIEKLIRDGALNEDGTLADKVISNISNN